MRALAYLDISNLSSKQIVELVDDGDAMHVRLGANGDWHRIASSRSRSVTACGLLLQPEDGRHLAPLRVAEYVGPLCPHCFTPYELAESERLNGFRLIPDSSNNEGDPDA
jgi:hypothetical protein